MSERRGIMRWLSPDWMGPIGLLVITWAFLLSRLWLLNLPLFWDELGVYGQSVFHLADNQICPTPSCLPPILSRGHPMLYVFLNAVWTEISGLSIPSLRLFNLLISLGLLAFVYRITSRHWNPQAGLMAASILAIQPLFAIQSVMILPEMMLAFFVTGMIGAWFKRSWVWYILLGLGAVWTKETGIVVPLALMSTRVLQSLFRKETTGLLADLALISAPLVGFFAFLALQKAQLGWFLFPYHESLIDLTPGAVVFKLQEFVEFLLLQQGRWTWMLVLLLVLAMRLLQGKGDWLSDLTNNPRTLTLVIVVLSLLLFSSLNAYMNRYLLLCFPLCSILVAAGLQQIGLKPRIALWGLLCAIPVLHNSSEFNYDEDESLVNQVNLIQQAVEWIEQRDDLTSVKVNFPGYYAFQDPRYGYLSGQPIKLTPHYDKASYIVRFMPGPELQGFPWAEVTEVKTFAQGGCSASIFVYRGGEE